MNKTNKANGMDEVPAISIMCTLYKFGIPILWKKIWVPLGKSMEDYDMGWFWNFIACIATEEEKMIMNTKDFHQDWDEKGRKMILKYKG